MKFFITTPIYYPNDIPHIGHAYTTIAADIIARWHKLKGDKVFFTTGTDENSIKVVQAVRARGMKDDFENIKKYVDEISEKFKYAWKVLNIEYDDFIRTTEERHKKRVIEVLKKVYENGDVYKGIYEGLYCEECEVFLLESELIDGECPIHKKEPKYTREENYFFRLSKYEGEILKILEKNFVAPEGRKREIINFVKGGLKDISISRPNLKWGIDFPYDKNHKIWVWFDALINYLQPIEFWPADLHLIGKDILRFHSVIWPAMLISAGYEIPKKIFAHGFFTINGQKISKSLGNVIDPVQLVEKYGADPVRYYIIRDIPFGEDGDFSENSLIARTNNELIANFGNLFYRVTYFIEKNFGEVPKPDELGEKEKSLINLVEKTKEEVNKLIDEVNLTLALEKIMELSSEINKYFQSEEPWKKIKTEREKAATSSYIAINSIYSLCCLLYPFIPKTCEKAFESLDKSPKWNFEKPQILPGTRIKSAVLFKKI
jgi:methionyl-tRNA synthetase